MAGFINARLTELREVRGLTQAALAERIQASQSAVSSYEKNAQPTDGVVDRLAEVLEVPRAFFFRPIGDGRVGRALHFRSLSNLAKRERVKAHTLTAWLSELLEYLEDYLDLPIVDLPEFDIGDPTTLTTKDVESLAMETRAYFGLHNQPVENLTELLESHGVVVVRRPMDSRVDEFTSWVGVGGRAVIMADHRDHRHPVQVTVGVGGRPVIMTDSGGSAVRGRFNLAHALGHLVLHRHTPSTKENIRKLEDQAHRFGSAFLMPAKGYTRDFLLPSLETFKGLKPKWGVAIAAQIMRCKDLGIINEDKCSLLFVYMNRREWRNPEPLDDIIEPEAPRLLKEAVLSLAEHSIHAPNMIPQAAMLGAKDIAELAGIDFRWFEPVNPVSRTLRLVKKRGA